MSAASLATVAGATSISAKADALENAMDDALNSKRRAKPNVCYVDGEPESDENDERPYYMHEDPLLAEMPEAPQLIDFYRLRFRPQHVLQSARLAKLAGHDETIVTACLLHDIGLNLMGTDHGYWCAQLVAPYVTEQVAWAIQHHQALRFFPDKDYDYEYPQTYIELFGEDYKPAPYIVQAYEQAKKHKWYETSRLITINDLYAFDRNLSVDVDDFVDIMGRNFKQPKEGLGFDGSPVAHMWRTLIWPNNFL
jgi:hypothetical protein